MCVSWLEMAIMSKVNCIRNINQGKELLDPYITHTAPATATAPDPDPNPWTDS